MNKEKTMIERLTDNYSQISYFLYGFLTYGVVSMSIRGLLTYAFIDAIMMTMVWATGRMIEATRG